MEKKILEELKESGQLSSAQFVNSYVSNENKIIDDIRSFPGIKSEFYCQDFYNSIDTTKFLSIYSDLTSMFMLPHKINPHNITYYDPESPFFINRQVTFPTEYLNGSIPEPHQILPCYTTQTDTDLKEVFTRLSPLIDRGKFIIRPIRTIMLTNNHPADVKGMIYYASSDTPTNHWEIKSMNENGSYVIDNGLKKYQSEVLYEITLPYLSNIPISHLSKILEDESDLLSSFRIALKDLMQTSVTKDAASVNELRNDRLRPQIETINRKFSVISTNHRRNVGASVIGITLSLIGVVINTDLNFQTLFQEIIGGGSVGMWFTSEKTYLSEVDKLRDNPYFLLWKISKANSSKIKKQF